MRQRADQAAGRFQRQLRVGVQRDHVADRRQHREVARDGSTKLVSVAPRSSRLNSASLPRLRSHPIQRRSPGFHRRSRWKQEEAVGAVQVVQLVDAASRGVDDAASSVGRRGRDRHRGKSASRAKCRCGSRFAKKRTSSSSSSDISARLGVDDRRNDHHRAIAGRECRRACRAWEAAAAVPAP